MSVFWVDDNVGYDGDFLHGHVKVNYWDQEDRAAFEAELARQLEHIRTTAGDHFDRLRSDD